MDKGEEEFEYDPCTEGVPKFWVRFEWERITHKFSAHNELGDLKDYESEETTINLLSANALEGEELKKLDTYYPGLLTDRDWETYV